jgi:hypothetical protein
MILWLYVVEYEGKRNTTNAHTTKRSQNALKLRITTMKPSTSSNIAARGSKIDGKIAASRALLSYPTVLTSLGNIMSRAVDGSKK